MRAPNGYFLLAFRALPSVPKKVPPHPIWNIRERQRANSNGRSQESPVETPAGTIEQTVLKLHNTINVEVVGDRWLTNLRPKSRLESIS
jgi:hypothetical protein